MGSRSNGTCCMKSTSPFCNALTAVIWSGMATHSTRSTLTTLPPAVQLGGSARGT